MIHKYCKVTIILRKRRNVKETIIVREWGKMKNQKTSKQCNN